MDFIFELLRSHASMTPEIDLDDTPVLDSLFSDPFASSMMGDEKLNEIIIKKTNLLMNSTSPSSGLVSRSEGPIYIRRVYLKTINFLDYRYVGWVLDDDMVICMICSEEFSLFTRRHHCRICGDVICDSCSNQTIYISEIRETGPVRVCNCCYYGQVPFPSFLTLPSSRFSLIRKRPRLQHSFILTETITKGQTSRMMKVFFLDLIRPFRLSLGRHMWS
jgi:hypothetical protein